jgi:hypothetical protein
MCVAVVFHNQITIYGVSAKQRPGRAEVAYKTEVFTLMDIVVEDLAEEIKCAAFDFRANLLAFGGDLSITYIKRLGQG